VVGSEPAACLNPAMPDLHVAVSGSGPPAVLVHGSMGFGALAFSEQRPMAEQFELHVVDRRGFGHSPDAAEPVDFELEAPEIAALLDRPAHLLGHSYGGIVCALAAALRPESVRSLTLIEPPAFGVALGDPAVDLMMERLDRHIRDGAGLTEEEYLRGFLGAWGFDLGPGPTLNDVARRSVRRSIGERSPVEARLPFDELAQAPFPALVARGGWDAVPAAARAIAGRAFIAVCGEFVRRLGAELAVFPGAAHQPQLVGEPFNRRIAQFWHTADNRGQSPLRRGLSPPSV
jgi:pimeloyl-ACP methyl ester carboxylesterase